MSDVQLTTSDVVTIRDALTATREHCAYHGADFQRSGMSRGLPRCDGCKLPFLVRQARAVLDDAQRVSAARASVAHLSRDDRTDRITTAIANTCGCADITVTVREADGTEAPLRRLARCLDGAGLIDHEGI